MSLVLKDRVQETTTTTGTGAVTLGGAVDGFQAFAEIGDDNQTFYVIQHSAENDWEVGLGTYSASGNTLSRDEVYDSSNGGALVDFAAGEKRVFVSYPAGQAVSKQEGAAGLPYDGTTSGLSAADTQAALDEVVEGPLVYREKVGTVSTGTLDLSTGNVFLSTPGANVTYTFSNPPANGIAFGFTLRVEPSATITLTWPAAVKWPDGTAPEAPGDGEIAVYVFYTQDSGTTYFGFVAGEDMS